MAFPIKDITGQRFGKLTAVRPTENRQNGYVIWEWRCDCGGTIARTAHQFEQSVKQGAVPSCGCLAMAKRLEKERIAAERGKKFDITGERLGRLTALRPTEERKSNHIIWEFLCDCGNTVLEAPFYLRRRVLDGAIPNCGCSTDITGRRFGVLTAVRPTEERKNGSVVWEWKCDCGNTVFRTAQSVKKSLALGSVSSCGCLGTKPCKNIEGERIGLLTAIRPTKERHNKSAVWEWRCDCGNAVFMSVPEVKRRKNPSCGCGWL